VTGAEVAAPIVAMVEMPRPVGVDRFAASGAGRVTGLHDPGNSTANRLMNDPIALRRRRLPRSPTLSGDPRCYLSWHRFLFWRIAGREKGWRGHR